MSLTLATVTPGEPEVFAALQGEGLSAGRPSVFIRLSRCNLACHWCDTAYTWHFTGDNRPHNDGMTFDRADNQVRMDEADAAARIMATGAGRLVITGGEPLLQAAALTRLLDALPGDMHVEIETNGTVAPPPKLDARIDQYNVSPKLSHSGNPAELALVPERLAAWAVHPKAWFKFVIATPADVEEVLAIQREHRIAGARIFLMPEGRSSTILRERAVWLTELCQNHGFNFTDRLHIHLHGDTRGT